MQQKKDELNNLEELDDLQAKIKQVRLVEKLGERCFHYDTKQLFEPLTDTIKNTSEDITKTITKTSNKNNKTLGNLNEKVFESMNDKGMIAPYLVSSLVNLFKRKNESQFRLIKDPNSTKMNEFKIKDGIPVTLYSNMLSFRDSNKSFKLDGDPLKTINNEKFNVGHSNLQDRKMFREFAEETNFAIKNLGPKILEIVLFLNCLNHQLSWFSEFPQNFYQLIFKNFVID